MLFAGLNGAVARPAVVIPICALQGSGFTSPYAGQSVQTRGIVTADLDETARHGFFLQAENCDSQPATSNGIFVYLGARGQVVSAGDEVLAVGTVQEYNGRTELVASPSGITWLGAGRPLPAPVELNPPAAEAEAGRYFEALEGMAASLPDGRVVGPTDLDDRTWVVNGALGLSRIFEEQPTGQGALVCVDDAGLYKIQPEAGLGASIQQLNGVLDVVAGDYCLELTAPPQVAGLTLPPVEIAPAASQEFHIATFNFNSLFDTVDDPATGDAVVTAATLQRRLQKIAQAIHVLREPDILAVQEVENSAVLQALTARPEISTGYIAELIEGPDERGLDVALLYRPDHVRRLGTSQAFQTCTQLVDGLGPDGNQDVYQPSNALTCDSDGDGTLDGNRLFSRPPLRVHLQLCAADCAQPESLTDLWVIVNHWKSRVEDSPVTAFTQARRQEQAQAVAGLVQAVRQGQPAANIIVLGDLNERSEAGPVTTLRNLGLQNPLAFAPEMDRYTYIYHGLAQTPDYILASLAPGLSAYPAEPVHLNAAYPVIFSDDASVPNRSSDHDPLLVHLQVLKWAAYLPLITTR